MRDNKRHYYAGIHLNDIGLDYWAAAVGEGLAKGKTARTSATLKDINRIIPASWSELSVVLRIRNHFKTLRADTAIFGGDE